MAVMQIQEILSKIYCRLKNLKIKELIDVQSDYGECKQVLKSYGNDISSCCTCTPSIKAYWANVFADEVLCKVVDANANVNHNISIDTNCQVAINYLLIRDLEIISYVDQTKIEIDEKITEDTEALGSRINTLETTTQTLVSQVGNLGTSSSSSGIFTLTPGTDVYKISRPNMRITSSDLSLDEYPSYGEQENINYIHRTFSYVFNEQDETGVKSVLFRFEQYGSINLQFTTSNDNCHYSIYKNNQKLINDASMPSSNTETVLVSGIVPGDTVAVCVYESVFGTITLQSVKVLITKPV